MTDNPLTLLDTAGFIKAFEIELENYPTKQAAFEAVNQEHKHHFQKLKYSNYDSFRNVKNRKMKAN